MSGLSPCTTNLCCRRAHIKFQMSLITEDTTSKTPGDSPSGHPKITSRIKLQISPTVNRAKLQMSPTVNRAKLRMSQTAEAGQSKLTTPNSLTSLNFPHGTLSASKLHPDRAGHTSRSSSLSRSLGSPSSSNLTTPYQPHHQPDRLGTLSKVGRISRSRSPSRSTKIDSKLYPDRVSRFS